MSTDYGKAITELGRLIGRRVILTTVDGQDVRGKLTNIVSCGLTINTGDGDGDSLFPTALVLNDETSEPFHLAALTSIRLASTVPAKLKRVRAPTIERPPPKIVPRKVKKIGSTLNRKLEAWIDRGD